MHRPGRSYDPHAVAEQCWGRPSSYRRMWVSSSQKFSVPGMFGRASKRMEGNSTYIRPPGFSFRETSIYKTFSPGHRCSMHGCEDCAEVAVRDFFQARSAIQIE